MSEADRLGCEALRFQNDPENYPKAKLMFEKSLDVEPENVKNLCNYALFCHKQLKQMDDAEALFKRGLEVAKRIEEKRSNYNEIVINASAACCSNYGNFLKSVRGYSTEAELMHEKAIR